MHILGYRADGAYALNIGGMAVVLRGTLVSRPLDLSEVDALGPWRTSSAGREEWQVLTQRLRGARQVPLAQLRNLGDVPGHPFRGNQWSDGEGGDAPPTVSQKIARTEPRVDHVKAHEEAGGKVFKDKHGNPRPVPVKVKSVDEAVEHLLAGKVVEVEDVRAVSTLIDKLAKVATDAAAKGENAPNFDLCNVSVKGSNLFCNESIRNARYPDGIVRVKMPQMSGRVIAGSPADKLPKNKKGEADGSAAFLAHLKSKGLGTRTETVPAAKLKASQQELVGPNVAGMVTNREFDPGKDPIYVSRDNYVVDGHHRWAAQMGRDAEDGTLGDKPMNIIRIDAPITEILPMATQWQKRMGFQSAKGPQKK